MALKNSQTSMQVHSEVKVRLLKLYIERYLNVLNQARFVGDVHLWDLFCGEGVYENGGKGSPIIFLETINEINNSGVRGSNSSKFHCNFNDINELKLKKLRAILEDTKLHNPEMGRLNITSCDYREIIPELSHKIKAYRSNKAFVFIDPYGYKDIKVNDIRMLVESKKAEVLLFLPTQFMFRFEKKGTPESLKNFIDELVPESSWPESITGIEFIEKLKDGFKKSLGKDYFVDSFIISREKNQFFCLFFFTSHIYGFDRMLDAKWKLDEEEGRGWKFNTENDLFSSQEKSPNTFNLEKKLSELLKGSGKTNKEIYEFTLHQGYRPTHAKAVLTKFQNEGALEISTSDGKKPRKGSFYINYENYKEDSHKILIKLKPWHKVV